MSASLLVLVGSTKIALVTYAYSINMFFFLILLVTSKYPVKYVYNFLVSGSSSNIYANTQLLFSSLLEKLLSISSANCSLFLSEIFLV